MKYLISAFLLVMSFAPLAAQADLIPEGEHVVQTTVSLDNAASFSGYNFYLTGGTHHGGAASQLVTGARTGVNITGGHLIAVKTSDQSKIISGADATCPECGDNWFNLAENKKYIIFSDLSLGVTETIPDRDSTTIIGYVLHVDRIDGQNMQVSIASTTKTTETGNSTAIADERGYAIPSQVTPVNAPAPGLILLAVLVALGVLVLVLAAKAWKK